MSFTKKCPDLECCLDLNDKFVGCYDPKKCETCDRAKGKINLEDDSLKDTCLICENYTEISICATWQDCCFGTCYDPGCEDCDQTKKTIVAKPNCDCCKPITTGISTQNGVGVCLEKCQKCVNGEPKPKCDTPDAPNCCPDTGVCYNPNCYDCTTGNLCGANEYCCGECGCCNKCQKCQDGQKVDISDNVGACQECKDGVVSPKCSSNQGCCDGDTCYDYDCEDCVNGYVYNNCDGRSDSKTLCCGGSCRDPYENPCMACKNNYWVPKCPPENNPKLSGCCNGTCFDTECSTCDNNTVVSKNEAGKICCVTKNGNNIYTEISNCCSGTLLDSGEICCNNTIIDSKAGAYECCGDQPINKLLFGCCYDNQFDKATQFCCNDNIYSYAGWKNGCCNGQPIDEYQGCCGGQPYDLKCYECNNDKIVPIFDAGCFKCSKLSGKESTCDKNHKCCSIWKQDGDPLGICYDPNAKACYECDPTQNPPFKPSCQNDPNGPDCCYDPIKQTAKCWDSTADLCKICDNGEIKDKCAGNSKWPGGKSSCCPSTGECYNDTCEECLTPGISDKCSSPSSNYGGQNQGTQAGWLGGCCYNPNTGASQCYNISCETCRGGIVRQDPNCKSCCNGFCCNTECCQLDSGIYQCCPDNTVCMGGRCCPKDQQCNSGCCPDGQFCSKDGASEICCDSDKYNCNGQCIEKNRECCGTTPNRQPCTATQSCCNNTCHDYVCCNEQPCASGQICCGTQCADPTECCGGTITPPSSCKECINGTPVDICPTVNGNKLTCCVGANGQSGGCADPNKCESCNTTTGAVIPYTPTKNDCYCVNGTEYCDCSNYPISWSLDENYNISYGSGVAYGFGGLSLDTLSNNDTWVYSGLSPTFISNYGYAGQMSIYVTCSDGTRVGTFFFVSYSSTNPHMLPSTVQNPCCQDGRLPPPDGTFSPP